MSTPLHIRLICTWFGAGLSPKAPGTMGSLAALPFAYVIQLCFGNAGLLLCAVVIFFIGWWASNAYLRTSGKTGDPQEIVVDEVAGMWLLLAALPAHWSSYFIGFALFRFFDIVKPWPVSWADSEVKGGLGVMLDDILAALYPLPFIALFYAI